jgi:hypothetical protein
MGRRTLPSAQFNREQTSHMRSYLVQKKEPFGGMPTATGHVPPFTVLLLFYQLRRQLIHFQSLMHKKQLYSVFHRINYFDSIYIYIYIYKRPFTFGLVYIYIFLFFFKKKYSTPYYLSIFFRSHISI